jgi:ribosomal protein S18 acetylase RimI-like enzyme
MQALAEYEGNIREFRVTEDDLLRLGFRASQEPQFECVVAEIGKFMVGYALTYVIPFTYDLRPTIVLKELFVAPGYRSQGIGQRIVAAVIEHGRQRNTRLLRWQVLPKNNAAKRFYRKIGGEPDRAWRSWVYQL